MKSALPKKMAKSSVEQFFKNQKQLEIWKKSLEEIEASYPQRNPLAIPKMQIKIRQIEINGEAVGRVLGRLTEEKRFFILLKYDKLMKDLDITGHVDAPLITLLRWNQEFLKEVELELLGKFDVKRLILRCDEIEGIIQKLDSDIAFFERVEDLIDLKIIHNLKRKKEYYQRFNRVIVDCMRRMSDKERDILMVKFFGGTLIDEEVAARCYVSRTLVATYSKNFKEMVIQEMEKEARIMKV